jgi:hypothetical protein
VATETDAARLRVLEARDGLETELHRLEAAARTAVDIPAKIRRSPGKAAAVVGGVGFLALKGPQRLFGGAKRVVRGKNPPLPKTMLPDEIEKTLRSLGSDGDKVRGTLERDFAAYAKQASRDRRRTFTVIGLTIARPILTRGAKGAMDFLFAPDEASFTERLAQIRARAEKSAADHGVGAVDEPTDRIAEVRAKDAAAETASDPLAGDPGGAVI